MAIAFPSPRPFEKAARTGRIPHPFTTGALMAFAVLIGYIIQAWLPSFQQGKALLDYIAFDIFIDWP
jgi:hypothetical protein